MIVVAVVPVQPGMPPHLSAAAAVVVAVLLRMLGIARYCPAQKFRGYLFVLIQERKARNVVLPMCSRP